MIHSGFLVHRDLWKVSDVTETRLQAGERRSASSDIRRTTRSPYSAEEKLRIVLEGLRGEESIAELCRDEGINQSLYCCSKEFLEASKKRSAGDTDRETICDEVKSLHAESHQLKEMLIELIIENRLLKNVSSRIPTLMPNRS